jgi:predicted transglutaminase-like cysteine proteinase
VYVPGSASTEAKGMCMLTKGQMQLLQDVVSKLKTEGKKVSESNIKDSIMENHIDFPEDWPLTQDIEDFVARQSK